MKVNAMNAGANLHPGLQRIISLLGDFYQVFLGFGVWEGVFPCGLQQYCCNPT